MCHHLVVISLGALRLVVRQILGIVVQIHGGSAGAAPVIGILLGKGLMEVSGTGLHFNLQIEGAQQADLVDHITQSNGEARTFWLAKGTRYINVSLRRAVAGKTHLHCI